MSHQTEWLTRFRNKFVRKVHIGALVADTLDAHASDIEDFIATLIAEERTRVVEILEGMRETQINPETGMKYYDRFNIGMVTGRNTTIDEALLAINVQE